MFRELLQRILGVKPRPLTRRETEVLGYMVRGWQNKEIAMHLGISHQSVKNYVQRIYQKLGVRNRVQATTYAIRKGWF